MFEFDIGLVAPLQQVEINQMSVELGAVDTSELGVAAHVDPVGQTICAYNRPNGLRIERVRVPLGVVAIIYESRPNVTSDAFGRTP